MPGRQGGVPVLPFVRRAGVLAVLCLLRCTSAGAQAGTAPPQPQTPQPAGGGHAAPSRPPEAVVDVDALPISLDRISEGLDRTPVINVNALRPTFRVQIVGTRPRWSAGIDWLGTENGLKPPAGTPWHDQFLNMVTPAQARSFGAFEGTDLLQVMATSLAQRLGAGAVAGKIKSVVHNRRERLAREEVDAAIAAWKKERDAEAARASRTGSTSESAPP